MNISENQAAESQSVGITKAAILNRVIAKSIDFLIIAALLEIIPRAGYFIGLAYLLIGDGLFEGRSLGKRLIGTRVILCETGKACSFRESIIRNFIDARKLVTERRPIRLPATQAAAGQPGRTQHSG